MKYKKSHIYEAAINFGLKKKTSLAQKK